MHLSDPKLLVELAGKVTKKRLVCAWPEDLNSVEAVAKAVDAGIVDASLVGQRDKIIDICRDNKVDLSKFKIIDESTDIAALSKSVGLINQGSGDILMKGNVSTDKFMRAILSKEQGLAGRSSVLSHVTVMKIPAYHKLLILGDVAVIPQPDLNQKIAIAGYLIKTAHTLGIVNPKLSVIAATEKVFPAISACTDGALLSKMAERGQIKGALIDGPLSLDLSLNKDVAKIKRVESVVAGDADCLLFPNIESGNIFYKTTVQYGNGWHAAVLAGTGKPVVLSSRGDSAQAKLNSIALAALLSENSHS